MGRYSSFPMLYEDCKTIGISDLKRWGYIVPDNFKGGVVTWSRHGNKTGSIGISVSIDIDSGVLAFNYNSNDEPRNYQVSLISRLSNLGKGRVWYFRCHKTGKLCRKLYLIGGYFVHRDSVDGAYYESQIESHKVRDIRKIFSIYFLPDKVYEERYKPYFKAIYGGKPTKKALKLQSKLDYYNRIKGKIPSEESIFMGVF